MEEGPTFDCKFDSVGMGEAVGEAEGEADTMEEEEAATMEEEEAATMEEVEANTPTGGEAELPDGYGYKEISPTPMVEEKYSCSVCKR